MKNMTNMGFILLILLASCRTTENIGSLTDGEKQAHLTKAEEVAESRVYDLGSTDKKIFAADPTIITYQGRYYMYTTANNREYDAYVSDDMYTWSESIVVYSDPDGRGGLWAPDVFHNVNGDGKFYLYYTVEKKVGVAVADNPLGPFEKITDLVDRAIDAMLFEDDNGELYLYFTHLPSTWNGWTNTIKVIKMSSPTKTQGLSRWLVFPDSGWDQVEHGINEAPWMIKHDGLYYLMFSGSRGDTNYYAVGYGTSKTPMGKFTKYEGNPILSHEDGLFGPGHNGLFRDDKGDLWIIYHRKSSPEISWGQRYIGLNRLYFDEEGVMRIEF